MFEKAKGRLPEHRRADILAEVDARLAPEEEDVEMAPAAEEAEGETEGDEEDETEFAELGVHADNPNDGEGELDIDAVDVGEAGFGHALGEADAPFEPAEDAETEEGNEEAAEVALKKRRLRGKQTAPVYGPPLPLPAAAAAVAKAALAGRAERRRRRNPKPSQLCPGQAGAGCAWSSARLGEPAEIQPGRGQTHCLFCGDAQLDKALAQQRGLQLTKTLKALRELDETKYEAALENLRGRRGAVFAADFGDRVDFAIYRTLERGRTPAQRITERWGDLLERRVRAQGLLSDDSLKIYEQAVRRDKMMIRRKIFARDCAKKRYNKANEEAEVARMPLPPADVAPNDSGLPAATLSQRAKMAEAWCKRGSWQICEGCGSVRPRPFQPVDLRSVRQPTIRKCLLCRRGVYVPQPDDIPEPLRSLPNKVLEALRPLDVDSGRGPIRLGGRECRGQV